MFGVSAPEGAIVVLGPDDKGALTVVGLTTGNDLDFPAHAVLWSGRANALTDGGAQR